MKKNKKIQIAIILIFTFFVCFSCVSQKSFKKSENPKFIYKRVTDSTFLALFGSNVEKVKEESLFFEFYKLNGDFKNIKLDNGLLTVIENHYGKLISNEFGKPKINNFKLLTKNKKLKINNTRFLYTLYENNYAEGVPAYPTFEKIVLLYNVTDKLLMFLYCDNFYIRKHNIVVVQSIRDKIITNTYEFDLEKNNFLLKESKSNEN